MRLGEHITEHHWVSEELLLSTTSDGVHSVATCSVDHFLNSSVVELTGEIPLRSCTAEHILWCFTHHSVEIRECQTSVDVTSSSHGCDASRSHSVLESDDASKGG